MAHSDKIISSIQLPNGEAYEIHDAHAIHSAAELGISQVMNFKGVLEKKADLPASGQIGDVYAVKEASAEYVWTGTAWEELGPVRDIASSNHTHAITSVAGHNTASAVTGSVTVPTVSKTSSKLSATASKPNITTGTGSVLGANTTFTVSGGEEAKGYINPSISPVSVAGDGSGKAVSGYNNVSKQNVVTELNSTKINNPSVTPVSIPNVTGNTSATATKISSYGALPTWSASVSDAGVLSFSFSQGALATGDDVTATNTVLGEAIPASQVSTDEVEVATGVKDSVSAVIDLGAASTFDALTGVKVSAQPKVELAAEETKGEGGVQVLTGVGSFSVTANGDNVTALTSAELAEAPTVTLSEGTSGDVDFVSSVEIGSATAGLVDGVAAAQTWTFDSGETGTPRG